MIVIMHIYIRSLSHQATRDASRNFLKSTPVELKWMDLSRGRQHAASQSVLCTKECILNAADTKASHRINKHP